MDYATLKAIHQGAAALSFAGFAARGVASLAGAAWVRGRAAKTLPHVVDSVLLLSALGLAWTLGLERAMPAWLVAKVVGLVVYIVLGLIALRPGRPTWFRAIAWVAALATFGWIVSVAVTKNPLGFVSLV